MKRANLMVGFSVLGLAAAVGCGGSGEGDGAARSTPDVASETIQVQAREARRAAPGEMNSLLVSRIKMDDAPAVEALLKEGATVEAKDRYGLPVLFLAAQYGDPQIVVALIRAGADVNGTVATSYNDDGVGYGGTMAGTPLSYAANYGKVSVMEALVAAGAKLDGRGPEGNTALMRAAENGHLEAVQWLLVKGADAQARNNAQQTAYSICQQFINPDVKRKQIMELVQGQ